MCSSSDAIAELDNMVFDGPYENVSRHDEIDASEGQLMCTVVKRPIYRDRRSIVGGIDKNQNWFDLRYENVGCALISRGAGAETRRMNDLRAVFDELKARNASR